MKINKLIITSRQESEEIEVEDITRQQRHIFFHTFHNHQDYLETQHESHALLKLPYGDRNFYKSIFS